MYRLRRFRIHQNLICISILPVSEGLPDDKTDNKQLFLTIELLDEAISRGLRISFKYLEYGTDKRQHSKIRPDGTERVYIISPYQMAAKEGKYYLRRCWSPSACRKRLKAL